MWWCHINIRNRWKHATCNKQFSIITVSLSTTPSSTPPPIAHQPYWNVRNEITREYYVQGEQSTNGCKSVDAWKSCDDDGWCTVWVTGPICYGIRVFPGGALEHRAHNIIILGGYTSLSSRFYFLIFILIYSLKPKLYYLFWVFVSTVTKN